MDERLPRLRIVTGPMTGQAGAIGDPEVLVAAASEIVVLQPTGGVVDYPLSRTQAREDVPRTVQRFRLLRVDQVLRGTVHAGQTVAVPALGVDHQTGTEVLDEARTFLVFGRRVAVDVSALVGHAVPVVAPVGGAAGAYAEVGPSTYARMDESAPQLPSLVRLEAVEASSPYSGQASSSLTLGMTFVP